ncbi:MAG: zinc ribbon domain-containing protein [Bacteroidota bacterium]
MEKVKCTQCGTENYTNSKYCVRCGYELSKIQTVEPTQTVLKSTTTKQDRKKKIISTTVGMICFALAYYGVQQLFFPSFDKQLVKIADELNKTCPVMIDQYTRWDNIMPLPNNSFQYNYTIIGNSKSEINLDTAKKYIKPNIINNVKKNPDLKFFRDHKTTLIYNYRDKNGEFVLNFSVTPDMYE